MDYYEYTSTEDAVVLILRTWNSTEWDTLYRFDAVPGDRWRVPGAEFQCNNGQENMLIVSDTDHVMVGDQWLRRQQVQLLDAGGGPLEEFTVIERLGCTTWFVFPALACAGGFESGTETLRCYADIDIQPDADNWPFGCASLTGTSDHALEERKLFPNPGTNHFNLTLPPGTHTLTVRDATGRSVLQQRVRARTATVHTEQLPAGLYMVYVGDDARPLRWMKQ